MVSKYTIFAGFVLTIACAFSPTLAFDNPERPFDHPEWSEWFAAQKTPDDKGGSCCNKADGHILNDDDVRIVANDYEVRTENGWLKFPNTGQGHPDNTVLGYNANPTGHSVAWWVNNHPYCFAEGTGS